MFNNTQTSGPDSVSDRCAKGARGLRRVYDAPLAMRLDVGETAAGDPEWTDEAGVVYKGFQQKWLTGGLS